MASLNQSRVGFSPLNNRRPIVCILFMLVLGSTMLVSTTTSAFQSQSIPTYPPSYRSIPTTSCVFSNKDPISDIFGSDSDDATSSEKKDATISGSSSSTFGESVPYVPLSQRSEEETAASNGNSVPLLSTPATTTGTGGGSDATLDVTEVLQKNRIRNIAVALASFAIAIVNYTYQFTHPVTAVEILASMEQQSASLTTIGNNGKPTVIDFWAPWCENCKVAAPTLKAVEEEYGDRVNFIMVNGDDGRNWPLIQLFGVDSIPHLAFLSGEGDVETALIGPVPRSVLRADIDALLNKKEDCGGVAVAAVADKKDEVLEEEKEPAIARTAPLLCHDELPYTMYDAFANRPDRRINFVEAMERLNNNR